MLLSTSISIGITQKTSEILNDTVRFWSYDNHFVDLEIDKSGVLFDWGIIKTTDGWDVGDKRKISYAEQLLLSLRKGIIDELL